MEGNADRRSVARRCPYLNIAGAQSAHESKAAPICRTRLTSTVGVVGDDRGIRAGTVRKAFGMADVLEDQAAAAPITRTGLTLMQINHVALQERMLNMKRAGR
ncbi:hypothetical protein D9M72_372270 [compost metagenome]